MLVANVTLEMDSPMAMVVEAETRGCQYYCGGGQSYEDGGGRSCDQQGKMEEAKDRGKSTVYFSTKLSAILFLIRLLSWLSKDLCLRKGATSQRLQYVVVCPRTTTQVHQHVLISRCRSHSSALHLFTDHLHCKLSCLLAASCDNFEIFRLCIRRHHTRLLVVL